MGVQHTHTHVYVHVCVRACASLPYNGILPFVPCIAKISCRYPSVATARMVYRHKY